MKTILFATGLSAVIAVSPATAMSLSYNLPNTTACYAAASSGDTTGLSRCTAALLHETTTIGEDRSANLVNRGILLLLADRAPLAGRDFDEALAIDPAQPEAWLGKAIESWQKGDSADAVSQATRAIQYRPMRPAVAYLVRGLANEKQGQIKAAYADLQMARQLEPGWQEPALELTRYKVVQR